MSDILKHSFIGLLLLFTFHNAVAQSEKLSLDKGWKFYQGDIIFPIITGHNEPQNSEEARKVWDTRLATYNDNNWRTVTLPHDWAIEGKLDSTENIAQGYYKRGIGWYRRKFRLSNADKGKYLELQFDGISTNCTVWFNGMIVKRNWCGYTSFYIDISSMAKFEDGINIITIRVDADAMDGWWYEGAGIYRHTWLAKRSSVHIQTNGVYANPVKENYNNWTIPIEVTTENNGNTKQPVEIESSLFDKNNLLIARQSVTAIADVLKPDNVYFTMNVHNPVLWSVDNPVLYKVVTQIKKDGNVLDEQITKCGFRTIRFDANTGFYLNDKPLKIQGVCNHQDHAGLGVAIPDAIWAFRMRKLKEMGVNAYRIAHNPPANELLDACDSLGLLVLDENRNFNISDDYLAQLKWMVKRDRNHPSVFMWSIFNEEPLQGSLQGYQMARRMQEKIKEYDTTRPVTAAMNGGLFNEQNAAQAMDVVGINYQHALYDSFHTTNPAAKIISTETSSAFETRGEYVTDMDKNISDSYDIQFAFWGATHRIGWKLLEERPYMAGGFIWTGFDYHGEPTPFRWPSVNSFFGILDLCGFPKTAFWIHQAQWRKDIDVLHLVPHWNWPADSIGKNIKVMALSNADEIKLLLNDKLISIQKADKYEMNTWQVPFAPGKLEAIGYKNGKEVSRYKVETTGAPFALQLIPDRNYINGDGTDAMPITVKALDAKGREIPTANMMVHFSINTTATIIGVGNGNPNSHEPEKGNQRSLFNGLTQVIIQSNENSEGYVELTATADGMQAATIKIPIIKKAAKAFVPVVD